MSTLTQRDSLGGRATNESFRNPIVAPNRLPDVVGVDRDCQMLSARPCQQAKNMAIQYRGIRNQSRLRMSPMMQYFLGSS